MLEKTRIIVIIEIDGLDWAAQREDRYREEEGDGIGDIPGIYISTVSKNEFKVNVAVIQICGPLDDNPTSPKMGLCEMR